ncbi:MAG: hypothetical protein NTW67_01170 [Candidatus Woesearchaeota archaeon]|nr:hypothetical protein [Candidatus Woesearchaeota archaeon]
MREALLRGISRLCWLFPPLKPNIRYSETLSQDEVDLFATFVNGSIQNILQNFDSKEQEHQISKLFKYSTGLSKIKKEDVIQIENILSAASSKDTNSSPEMKDVVEYLRNNKKTWWSLHNTYEKIVKNNLTNTCPLATAKLPILDRLLPFGFKLHQFQEFHKLFHESIHYILEKNRICLHDKDLDEGLVVFLHQQVMGKKTCALHYTGEEGEKYLQNAEFFEKLLNKYPHITFLPIIKNSSSEELKAL